MAPCLQVDLSLIARTQVKKPGTVAFAYNPSTVNGETYRLPGQFIPFDELQAIRVPVSNK